MRSLAIVFGGVALFALPVYPQPAFTFQFSSIDVPLVGASDTKAFEINARGDIVGRYFMPTSGPFGFIQHPDGTFTAPVIAPVANSGTTLRGINSRGDIVGKY